MSILGWVREKKLEILKESQLLFSLLSLFLLGPSPPKVCVSFHALNMPLFSLGMTGNFCFLQVPRFVAGNFYRFENEGYLLEVFKMRFFLTELCLCITQFCRNLFRSHDLLRLNYLKTFKQLFLQCWDPNSRHVLRCVFFTSKQQTCPLFEA